MFTETTITIGVIVIAVIIVGLTIWGMLSRYQRAAPDELLVVYGKSGRMKTEDWQDHRNTFKDYSRWRYIRLASYSGIQEDVNEAIAD